VLVSANNNNAGDESARNKSQSDKLKLENEQLKQKLETEAENAKVWQQTQVSNNTMLENELAASRQEAMALAERVRALEQELGAALSSSTQSSNTDLELVTLNAQVNTLKFENTSLKAQLRLASSSAFQGDSSTSNNNTNKAMESELSEAKAAIEQKDRELAQLRREAEEMKKKSTERSAQEQILRAQLNSALTEVRKLSENAYINNASLKQLAELKTENEVLQTELQQQSKMKRQLMSDVEELRASMESANTNGEVVRLLAENTQLTAQMISLQNEYQELDITLHKVQASHVELQSEFDSLRVQQLNGTSGQSDSNLVALEQELKQKQAEVQQLTDEVQQWSQAAAQLQIVNEEMVRELQQEIHELNKELQELSDAYQQELDRRIKVNLQES
jgi:chromosome segregation ATPase